MVKKILAFGALLSLAFFVATTTHAAKLDTKGRNYWTVEFKLGKIRPLLRGNYSLKLESDTNTISLEPGDIGKLSRDKNFKIQAQLNYSEVRLLLTSHKPLKRYSYQTKFDTNKHYITIKVVANPLKLWLEPKLKVRADKKNDGLESRASTRLAKLQGEWNRKFRSGCIGVKACRRRNVLLNKMKLLR